MQIKPKVEAWPTVGSLNPWTGIAITKGADRWKK
jgi:hypothetical protein